MSVPWCALYLLCPSWREVLNTSKQTQLKAMAQCTVELWGTTTLSFSECLHLALSTVLFSCCILHATNHRFTLFILSGSGRFPACEPELELSCIPLVHLFFLWRRGWSSSNALTNSCSVIAIIPVVYWQTLSVSEACSPCQGFFKMCWAPLCLAEFSWRWQLQIPCKSKHLAYRASETISILCMSGCDHACFNPLSSKLPCRKTALALNKACAINQTAAASVITDCLWEGFCMRELSFALAIFVAY